MGRILHAQHHVARAPGRQYGFDHVVLALSGGLWVHAFSTVEGQPQWTVFLPDESWLTVVGGRLVRNTQNAR